MWQKGPSGGASSSLRPAAPKRLVPEIPTPHQGVPPRGFPGPPCEKQCLRSHGKHARTEDGRRAGQGPWAPPTPSWPRALGGREEVVTEGAPAAPNGGWSGTRLPPSDPGLRPRVSPRTWDQMCALCSCVRDPGSSKQTTVCDGDNDTTRCCHYCLDTVAYGVPTGSGHTLEGHSRPVSEPPQDTGTCFTPCAPRPSGTSPSPPLVLLPEHRP